MTEDVKVLWGKVGSTWQLDIFKTVAEGLETRLKQYLCGTLGYIGYLEGIAKASNKPSPFLELELDSTVSRQLFQLKLEVYKSLKKCFSDFEDSFLVSLGKFCNLSEEHSRVFSIEAYVQQTTRARQQLEQRTTPLAYENYQKFLLDIPRFTLLGEQRPSAVPANQFVLGKYLQVKIHNTGVDEPVKSICRASNSSAILRTEGGLKRYDLAHKSLQPLVLEGVAQLGATLATYSSTLYCFDSSANEILAVSLGSGPTERLVTPLSALNRSMVPEEDSVLTTAGERFVCRDGELVLSPNTDTLYVLSLETESLRSHALHPGPPYASIEKTGNSLVLLSSDGTLQILSEGSAASVFDLPPEVTWNGILSAGGWLVLWASAEDNLILQALHETKQEAGDSDLTFGHEAQLSLSPGDRVVAGECLVLASSTRVMVFVTSQGRLVVFTIDKHGDIKHQLTERVSTKGFIAPTSLTPSTMLLVSEAAPSSLVELSLRAPY